MDKLEFIKFKHSVIFPYLKHSFSSEQRAQLIRENNLWKIDVDFQKVQSHSELNQYGFKNFLVEEPQRSMADIAWTLESLLGLHSAQIQSEFQHSPLNTEEQKELVWKEVNSDALGTPLSYLDSLFKIVGLRPGQTVIDLGSGFGNIGHYIGFEHPESKFIGYEIISNRVLEAQRIKEEFQLNNCHFFNLNMGTNFFELPEADIYFLYDSLCKETKEKLIRQMGKNMLNRPFKLIAIKGTTNLLKELEEIPWLTPDTGIELYDPYRLIGIYSSI